MQNLTTLHIDPGRRAYYAATAAGQVVFDRSARCWVVTGAENSEALLRSRDLEMPSFDDGYAALAQRYGLSFPNLAFAARYLPLCNNGEAHQRARRLMAAQIAARRLALSAALPGIVERHMDHLVAGEIEVLGEVIEPLVAEVTAIMTETEITDMEPARQVGRVFDRLMGVRLRQRLDEHMGALRAMIRSSGGPALSAEDEGIRLSFFVFGQDTVVGTIGETLHRMASDAPGARLDSLSFPSVPCETGVPYAERIVLRPFSHGGVDFAAGDLVRIMVQEFGYADDPRDAARLFGLGFHACLGRQIALDVWQRIAARLSRLPLSWQLISCELRHDFLMVRPTQLKIRFT